MASELERFLESQSSRPDFSSDGIAPEYMVVLNHFWNQRFEEVADHASVILATYPEHPATLRFYRAWIEALAELDDVESLEALGSHLLTVGRVQLDKRAGFMALRGIIHLHLDQVPAARLVFRALQGFGSDPYCLEFEQMSARRGFEGARELALAFSVMPLLDWFQWNNMLADLAAFGPADQLGDVLGHVANIFPGSPNLDVCNMHHAIDTKHWPGALAAATKLHASFPHHRDYGFMKALSANQNGDLDLAIATLRGLGEHLNEIDADIKIGRAHV